LTIETASRRCDAPLRYAASGTSTRAPSRSMVSEWAMTGEP
jgi:hypothetical protein